MAVRRPLEPGRELLESFDHAMRVTEYLVRVLPPKLWRAQPPDGGRTIAANVAHIQSVRRTFAKMGGARPAPSSIDRLRATPAQARRALGESREALNGLFREAMGQGKARVTGMPRRAVNMMTYLVQHDAHHRGQICRAAHALGHRLPGEAVMRIWGWKKLTAPRATGRVRRRPRSSSSVPS